MQVFPDSEIRILRGCPCDPDYEHTLYFGTKAAQYNYFVGLTKYRVQNATYQRAKRGRIRVEYKCDDLYDCNYIMFQNTAFGNKWFYGFIDDLTYINNVTTEITYTIDVLQSWLFDFSLQECFVSREHSATDVAGENLVPENLETGTMVSRYDFKSLGNVDQLSPSIVVASLETEIGTAYEGNFYGNSYSQAVYTSYPPTASGIASLTEYLTTIGFFNNPDAVMSIFMCPNQLLKVGGKTPYKSGNPPLEYSADEMGTLTRSDGTPVRNKKLQTYPYTYLRVTNLCGGVRDYAYEFFAPTPYGLNFWVNTTYTDTFSMTITPRGYKVSLTNYNYDESLTYNNFPKCPYAVSDFTRRLATAGISAAVSGIAAVASGGALAPVALAALGGAAGGFNSGTVTNANAVRPQPIGRQAEGQHWEDIAQESRNYTIRQVEVLGNMLPQGANVASNPSSTSGNDLFNAGKFGFYYTQMQPTQEYIDRIDDYFSRYGYSTNKIKTPNISSRPHWNYVQTIGCKVNGSIPCNDERLICAIFDKGVTFWKNPAEVGNFSLDNSPA